MTHVLYIDPDSSLAASVTDYFAASTITVRTAANATQALQQLEQALPQVVILETALGKNSGLEFLHEFFSYPEWRHIPVIVCTQQNLQAYTARLQALGVRTVLYKPHTTLQTLLGAVKRLL